MNIWLIYCLVDINYLFHPACRAKPGNETTILADTSQLETFLKDLNLQTSPKFPTECFWLTMLYHHIGLVPSMRKLTRVMKDLYQIVKELKRLRGAKPANEMEKKQQQVIMDRYDQQARFLIQQVIYSQRNRNLTLYQVICLEAWLFDETTCKNATTQVSQFSIILMKLITGSDTGSIDANSVPKVPPSCWSAFPECLIEDLTDFVIFISQQMPHLIREAFDQSPSLPDFLSLMVCSPTFFRNPYLVAKFIEIMFNMHPSHGGDQGRKAKRDAIYELIVMNRLNHANLAPSLMKFYTDVEQTGGSNEFYDKFSIRHHIQGTVDI